LRRAFSLLAHFLNFCLDQKNPVGMGDAREPEKYTLAKPEMHRAEAHTPDARMHRARALVQARSAYRTEAGASTAFGMAARSRNAHRMEAGASIRSFNGNGIAAGAATIACGGGPQSTPTNTKKHVKT